jgi:type IV pilus assembly protein PilW
MRNRAPLPFHAARSRAAGFTIVEIMVGMLIGLIATVVMFQVFAISEGQKRTTTGAGDAQQNGVASLFQIERDARMAGYAVNHLPLLGCTVNGFYQPTSSAFTFRLAPVLLTDGAAGAPDSITIVFGSTDLMVAPVKLTQTMAATTTALVVDNRFGFQPGDLIIAAEAGRPCSLAQVRDLPTIVGQTTTVLHNPGTYTDPQGNSAQTIYNSGGGLAVPYNAWNPAATSGGRLYNLGSSPTVVTYTVQSDQLVALNVLAPGSAPTALSDGIVQLQVQYGYDGNLDGSIPANAPVAGVIGLGNQDQWGDVMPAGAAAADWQKVIAVRMAIVSRSMTPERPNPSTGVCDTTTANPLWIARNVTIDITANPDWRCYRYRVFEVTVPLRNMVWFAQPA